MENELGILPYILDNVDMALMDLQDMKGVHVEKATKYLVKALAELKLEGKERLDALARRDPLARHRGVQDAR